MDRRDRHGRGMRGPLARPPVPIARTRAQEFDDLVLDAVDQIGAYLAAGGMQDGGTQLGGLRFDEVQFVVEDVPAFTPNEEPDRLPLAATEARTATSPPVVIVYRRTIELRSELGTDRAALVHDAVVDAVADLFGVEPEDIDPEAES